MTEEGRLTLSVWFASVLIGVMGFGAYRFARARYIRWIAALLKAVKSSVPGGKLAWNELVASRRLRISIAGLGLLAATVCIVLPVFGARSVFAVFRLPFNQQQFLMMLGEQLFGPIFLFMIGACLLILTILGKRTSWWLGVFGVLGGLCTMRSSMQVSHDFSHAVFQECGSVYSDFIAGTCVLIAACYLLVSAAGRRTTG